MTQSGTGVCSSFKVVGAVKEKYIWPKVLVKTGTQSENRSMSGAVGLEHRDSGIQRLRYVVVVSFKLLKQRVEILCWIRAVIGSQ